MIGYLISYYPHMLSALLGHLEILVLTLFIGTIASVALSFLVYRFRILTAPVLGILEIFYAIPSLAFFAILIPFLGLGLKTAVAVLSCYSLFFMVRNFLEGLDGIDPMIVEAGRSVGYSPWELFVKVELPLAMPAIIAGVRMAAMSTIGIGCIAYAIGAGGIGTILFEGMRQMSYVKISWGAVLAIALAVAVNNLFLSLESYFARLSDPGGSCNE